MSVDPLFMKYPGLMPYHYCGNNPVMFVDPDGRWLESAWDILNIGLGKNSLSNNISSGNYFDAAINGAGILLDAVALALSVFPAGVRTAIKTARAADKAIDATKLGDKYSDL